MEVSNILDIMNVWYVPKELVRAESPPSMAIRPSLWTILAWYAKDTRVVLEVIVKVAQQLGWVPLVKWCSTATSS